MKPTNIKTYFNIIQNKPALVVLAVIAVLVGQLALPLDAMAADPAFNAYTPYTHTEQAGRDYFLLDVKNDTKGTSWGFPASADAGDVLTFYFYYHNSTPDTVAYNTMLQIAAPGSQNSYQTVSANLWADNTTNASRVSPMSQSVGINLSTAQTLQYVPGTARWYPNQADWRVAASTPFPNGQTESQLFGGGINIGSVQGCWPYSGAIVFRMTVGSTAGSPNLALSKMVRNQTQSQSGYSNSANAYSGDRLTFQIQVSNSGNVAANNVIVRDALPSQLNYVFGSTYNNNSSAADGIVGGGINIGSVGPGATATILFDATVNSSYSAQTITNTAYVSVDQMSERSSSASVYLQTTSASAGSLTINKTVRNYTYGYGNFAESVNATNNDRVTFQIQISNNSNFNAYNVIVSDSLPSGLSFVPGTARLDNGYISDSIITSGGVNIGSMYPGATRTISFDATVGYLGTGYNNQTYTNYAYVRADQINERNDSAAVYASQSAPYTPYYSSPTYYSNMVLTKTVRNLSADQAGLASVANAQIGDRLLFAIQLVTSPSGANQYNQVNNVRVWDILPSGLTYTPGTARMDGGLVSDSLVSGNGISVGTLFSNQTKTITFEATVNSYGGNQTITNYGYASGDGIAQQSAFAQVLTGNTAYVAPATVYPTQVVKGASVQAVTGGNDLARNIALSLIISMWGIFMIYLFMEHENFWKDLRFKFVIWKIRLKEKAM